MHTKLKIGVISSIIIAGLVLVGAQAHHSLPSVRAINPPGSPTNLPFSNGLLVGNTLYVAGIQGQDAHSKLVPGGIKAQTRQALENIRKVVEAGGLKMGDVVAVNVYLADANEFGEMNSVYKTFFPNPKPTRTTVQVARLVNDARIEISAVAVKHR